MIIFGKGATAEGTEISPKVRTHLPPVQHATRKNDHGDEEGQEEKEVEVSDLCAGLVLGQRHHLRISRSALNGASRNGWTKVRPFPFWA
jgi:hypothetical protein